jgi:hypothetical protein
MRVIRKPSWYAHLSASGPDLWGYSATYVPKNAVMYDMLLFLSIR